MWRSVAIAQQVKDWCNSCSKLQTSKKLYLINYHGFIKSWCKQWETRSYNSYYQIWYTSKLTHFKVLYKGLWGDLTPIKSWHEQTFFIHLIERKILLNEKFNFILTTVLLAQHNFVTSEKYKFQIWNGNVHWYVDIALSQTSIEAVQLFRHKT